MKKINKLVLAMTLSIASVANANVLSSSLGVTSATIISNLIVQNVEGLKDTTVGHAIEASYAVSSSSLLLNAKILSHVSQMALDFLSTKNKSGDLEAVMREMKLNEDLENATDEELAVLILEAAGNQ